MNRVNSLAIEDALASGVLMVSATASIAPCVRFVPMEDDGKTCGPIKIDDAAVIREGAIICSGVIIGSGAVVGHHTVLRAGVQIGSSTIISHLVCVERETRIGGRCRVSSLTHLTAACIIEDDVQIGARVVTINDKELRWRRNPQLIGVTFRRGCRIGSGVTLMSGIEIGERAFIGAGAVVTKNIPPDVLAYGVPAYIQGEAPAWLEIVDT